MNGPGLQPRTGSLVQAWVDRGGWKQGVTWLRGLSLGGGTHEGIEDDLGLGEVRGGALNEHVLGVQRDGRVGAVDDGGQRQHGPAQRREM